MKPTKAQREELQMMFGGKCAYCGCELGRGWHADHVEPVYRKSVYVPAKKVEGGWVYGHSKATGEVHNPENDTLTNLFPACRRCNCSKNAFTLEGWRKQLSEQPRMCRDYSTNYNWALRFGLVVETNAPVVFHFERYAEQKEAVHG